MRRTLIYLPSRVVQAQRVKQSGHPRPSVTVVLRAKLMQQANARDFFQCLSAFSKELDWSKTPKDLSTTIDAYLYGDKSKYARRR